MDKGTQLKRIGIAQASESHEDELEVARKIARQLGRTLHYVSIDDVRLEYQKKGLEWNLGNAAGAVFQTKDWRFNRYVRSRTPSNHSRIISQWRYDGVWL